jgi:hypothetical protein
MSFFKKNVGAALLHRRALDYHKPSDDTGDARLRGLVEVAAFVGWVAGRRWSRA